MEALMFTWFILLTVVLPIMVRLKLRAVSKNASQAALSTPLTASQAELQYNYKPAVEQLMEETQAFINATDRELYADNRSLNTWRPPAEDCDLCETTTIRSWSGNTLQHVRTSSCPIHAN